MTDESTELTHVRPDGTAHMVDVSAKRETVRRATAEAWLHTNARVVEQISTGDLPKGDALAVARVAGIMAAKQTSSLIPLCHPLPLCKVTVDFAPHKAAVRIEAQVSTTAVTGVEMEALTAVSVGALTLYDMIKAADKHAEISGIKVLAKSGGKSGDWKV